MSLFQIQGFIWWKLGWNVQKQSFAAIESIFKLYLLWFYGFWLFCFENWIRGFAHMIAKMELFTGVFCFILILWPYYGVVGVLSLIEWGNPCAYVVATRTIEPIKTRMCMKLQPQYVCSCFKNNIEPSIASTLVARGNFWLLENYSQWDLCSRKKTVSTR